MVSIEKLVGSATKLVSLPDVYFKVRLLLDDPDLYMGEVAEVLEKDPGLTSRLLKIANSPFFGFRARVETVSRAVTLLGTQQVHDLVLATSVARAFSNMDASVMDMARFWHDSVLCGAVARLLAQRCNVLHKERLFVAGLLCDIGHLIMYQEIPQETEQALRQAREQGRLPAHLEQDLIGFDYTQVGGELMKAWGLPAAMEQVVRHHMDAASSNEHVLEASIVHFAKLLAAESESQDMAEILTLPFDDFAFEITGLSEDIFPDLLAEAEQEVAEVADMVAPAGAIG
jgi:HD-like signal output (HDOD) protein